MGGKVFVKEDGTNSTALTGVLRTNDGDAVQVLDAFAHDAVDLDFMIMHVIEVEF